MPFGLKNAGATYQRLVDKAFASQIGKNMDAYVDDLVIKSKTEYQMLDYIQETFQNLRKVNMKLNPEKCSFGFEEGKFLGHIVGKQSIKANPNKTTNNEAEYEALIAGLRLAKEMKVQKLEVFTDSLLVVSSQIPRSQNKMADALSKLASLTFAHLTKKVLVEVLKAPSIDELEVQDVVTDEDPNWMTPIKKFLKNGELPNDQIEAERVKIKARQYVLQGETLYKKGYLAPLLRCVGPK
ncbi:uncharacterized protein LOC110882149 [Helianthus annuus]|uniref:uncharacterized protein LOC110882149 n=1 Tax=Helianthus annuus TaxID=4232 RepID=UPI000B8F7A7B|nr:uncharacterized protein LOC110882149 [Helianthus annuus]